MTDVADGVEDLAAAGDCQLVAGAGKAHVERICAVGPERAGAADQHRVAAGTGVVADVSALAEDPAAVGDGQLIAGTEKAHVEMIAIGPERAGTADQHRVVVRAGTVADLGAQAEDVPAVGDGQLVE